MPRITTQKKSARGKHIKCDRCGVAINIGDEYRKWSKRTGFGRISGVTYYRCMKSACSPRGSELLSGRSAEVAAVGESLEDVLNSFTASSTMDIDALMSSVEDVIGDAEDLHSDVDEAFENMPEGLQQGDTGQRLEEIRDALDTFKDELENFKSSNEDAFSDIDDDESEEDKDKAKEDKAEELLSELGGISLEC